jgi:hypothetical protein
MQSDRSRGAQIVFALTVLISSMNFGEPLWATTGGQQGQQPSSETAAAKPIVGTIKAVSGRTITFTPDAGSDIRVAIQDSTRIVRVAPGQKDLKSATVIQLEDLQAGDRILVRGDFQGDPKSVVATAIIAMKRSDVEAKQEREREDWQKRGAGGLVSAVDAANGTVTISLAALGGKKTVVVHASKDTIVRRYAPDSVKFDDAKPSMLAEIKPGDQLRARGNRNADGNEVMAEEIVSGAFRNIAGTVIAIDSAANTVSVKDLISKRTVLVKIAPDSRVGKLPLQFAQMIAMRLKGLPPGGSGEGARGSAATPAPAGVSQRSGQGQGAPGGFQRSGGPPDFQQMVNRMPQATLAEFQKGDAVMIVSTEGTDSGGVTAITLLGGVEPILTASPNGEQMFLSPWSLGSSAGDQGTE